MREGGRLQVVEAALKPLKIPPPAHVWMRGRWKKGSGVVGVSGGIVVSFHSGGEVSNLSENGRRGDENEP